MTINLRQLLEKGHEAKKAAHAAKEVAKAGQFRIGSAGCVSDAGELFGICHRIALARSLGRDKPIEDSQHILFGAGEANEDTWTSLLEAAGAKVLRHDQIAIDHPLEGTEKRILGTPDIVLLGDDGKPALGIELKGIYGYTTAISVYFENTPKNENLIQAAAYSMYRGIPYVLAYTLPAWVKLQWNDRKKYQANDGNIRPFYRIFHMEWRGDTLWYRPEFLPDWVETVITKAGIEKYYRLLEEMGRTQQLGPRPTDKYVDGRPMKYGACGICDFSTACDEYDIDANYSEWLDRITALSQKGQLNDDTTD